MNKYFSYLAVAFLLALIASCREDIPASVAIEPYAISSNDDSAFVWHTVWLKDPSVYYLQTPPEPGTSEYDSELKALKEASSNLTGDQLSKVKFWAGDGLVRWNELAREFISKYNLPPSPNSDGTYGVPNSADPGTYPYFPFAHPTYACRALAYLSGAQYDAMISTWYFKRKFAVPAHHVTDPSVQQWLPNTTLSSYPAEGAVIAAVSRSLLTALFPLEKARIDQMWAEHRNSLLWSGRHTAFDINSSDTLGTQIAGEFKKRMSTDGMKSAQTSKAVSDSIRDAAQARFGWSWQNLESPQRPIGITPLFGKVKPWFIPSVEAVRPGPPPAPGSAEFRKAADELKSIADNLTKEQRRIAYFYADGIGTYSPPGHWNRIAVEQIVQKKMSPVRAARVLAYMNYAIMDAGISCWDTKYHYHYPRPSQAIPGFKTLLGIPNFPAYTSGHSTFSNAAAGVLGYFFPAGTSEFNRIADEAAKSRLYGGIHYRFDSEAGQAVGTRVASYSIAEAAKDHAE